MSAHRPSIPTAFSVSPRAAVPAAFAPSTVPSPHAPQRPQRPLSASRVPPPARSLVSPAPTARISAASPRVSSRIRPASARPRSPATPTTSRCSRANQDGADDDVDTILFAYQPCMRIDSAPSALDTGRTNSFDVGSDDVDATSLLQSADGTTCVAGDSLADQAHAPVDRASVAKAELFLAAWQREETSFRSPALFAEASFGQAKAMTATWPMPNAVLSSVAFSALELMGQTMERQHPFLADVLDALGASLFSNFAKLKRDEARARSPVHAPWKNKFLYYVQHGRFYYQEVQALREQIEALRTATHNARQEVKHLQEQAQKHHLARLFERVQAQVKTAAVSAACDGNVGTCPDRRAGGSKYPHLRRALYSEHRGAQLDLNPSEYEFEPCNDEVALFFNSLPPGEAQRLLNTLLAKAAESETARLPEIYAAAIDQLPESQRRLFLTEYFQLVASKELQEALNERDETNHDKQWQSFLEEMIDVLRLGRPRVPTGSMVNPSEFKNFHSDEARICAKVHDMVDLLEEISAELSVAEQGRLQRLSAEVTTRLEPFHSATKTVAKARKLMMSASQVLHPQMMESVDTKIAEPQQCGCSCGNHRLEPLQAIEMAPQAEEERDRDGAMESTSLTKPTRKMSQKPPSSANGKRKSSINVAGRASTRGSAMARLFPLSDSCNLVSMIVQLQFSRDTGATRRNSSRRDSQSLLVTYADRTPSFKAVAKDFLTRKYGIKSIAVMHLLQLEKSLSYHGAGNNLRCELFAWFMGADRVRAHYKDYAYSFYLRLVKCVTAQLLNKPKDTLSYADLITAWTDLIGDGDSSSECARKVLATSSCLEACKIAFPLWIKESGAFKDLTDRLWEAGGKHEHIDVDDFFKRAMGVWNAQFVKVFAQIEESMDFSVLSNNRELDLEAFIKCVKSAGVEIPSTRVVEDFDRISGKEDTVSTTKALLFVVESLYLRYRVDG